MGEKSCVKKSENMIMLNYRVGKNALNVFLIKTSDIYHNLTQFLYKKLKNI